jgi:uncharacterized membrane protein
VRWFSWVALVLSIASLLAAFSGKGSYKITAIAMADLAVYLLAYFIRLQFMSRLAKSDDENARTRYFVEEQMVATPMLVLTLVIIALVGSGPSAEATARGFTSFFSNGLLPVAIIIGLLSQGTGIFGGLILLDKRENTYCVPVNRASSILAGIVASYANAIFLGMRPPGVSELVGAALIILAIVVLSVPPLLEKRRARLALAAASAAAPLPVAAETDEAPASDQRASGT